MICTAAVAGTVAGLGGLGGKRLLVLPHQIFVGDAVIHVGPGRYLVQTDGPLAIERRVDAQIGKGLQPCVVLEALFPAVKVTAALVGFHNDRGKAAALFLGIVCSGVCLVIQSVYQKHTTASRASLIFTLEPVFSAIFAFFLLGERIGVKGYIGSALMLASLVLVEVDGGALFGKNKKKAD